MAPKKKADLPVLKLQFLDDRKVLNEHGEVIHHYKPGEVVDFTDKPDSGARWLRRNICIQVADDTTVGVAPLDDTPGESEYVEVDAPKVDEQGNVIPEPTEEEKAAAEAAAAEASRVQAEAEALLAMSVEELQTLCDKKGIDRGDATTQEELVALLSPPAENPDTETA